MRQSIAAIALIRRDIQGQTLWLAQWNEAWQAYSFVGGHKHEGESFRESIIREIDEELGLMSESDVLVSASPARHLEYVAVSQRNDQETSYTIELFEAALIGEDVLDRIAANPDNCWLTEKEIIAGRAIHDGRPVSATPKRYLIELGRVG